MAKRSSNNNGTGKKDQTKKYKGNPEDYKRLDLSDEKMQWLLDKVTEDVLNDEGIRFPQTDEDVLELMRQMKESKKTSTDEESLAGGTDEEEENKN